jgi:hypothetical protein
MKGLSEIARTPGIRFFECGEDGFRGQLEFKDTPILQFICSWGGGWEHVSVSLPNRCPTWPEICLVKDMFWPEDQAVVQYHPRTSEYVNWHPFCLHLWRPINQAIPTPPAIFVGPTA